MTSQPKKVLGSDDEEYTGFFINWIEEWSQFFSKCNWYTFTAWKLEFEDDRCMGGLEATFIFMGLGARIRYNYKITEVVAGIKHHVAEADAGKFTGVETDYVEVAWYINGEKVDKETYETLKNEGKAP